MLRALVAIVLLGFGCTPIDDGDPSVEPRTSDLDSDSPTTPRTSATLSFRTVRFDEGALELDVVDAPYDTHAWDRGGVLGQVVPLAVEEQLRILVRAGEGESLKSLRSEHSDDDVKTTYSYHHQVCGGASPRVVIRKPEVFIECVEYADGRPSSPAYIPATTIVAQEFRHSGLDVVVSWEIPTELRRGYRDEERHFFDAVRCLAD